MKKRIVCMLMAITMLLSSVDVSVFAEEVNENIAEEQIVIETETEEISEEIIPTEIEEVVDEEVIVELETEGIIPTETEEVEEEGVIESETEIGNVTVEDVVASEEVSEIASGSCGDDLTWVLTSDGLLTISGTGAMDDYDVYDNNRAPWYKYREQMSALKLENGITSIGKYAFNNCSGLTGDLVIPDSITVIGEAAFSDCSGFSGDLIISDSVTYIGRDVFYGCSGLTGDLVIPNSLTSIGVYAFKECSGFTGSLVIPDSVTSIGEGAFSGCSGFTGDLVIPDSVTYIEGYAFSGCSGLTGELRIPNNITKIQDGAFASCSGLTGDLLIPESVTSIGKHAFSDCSGLTGDLVIPNSVTSIGSDAFRECSGFTGNLVIPESVTSIGEGAFSGCSGLTGDLVIPNSITAIDEAAFSGCSGFMGDLIIPFGVRTIGEAAFAGCSNLSGDVYIPLSVTYIDETAFEKVNTIYGIAGSYAETYANENSILFIEYEPEVIDSGKCGENLEWKFTVDGVFKIFGTGDMYDYQIGEAPWNDVLENSSLWCIRMLILEKGLTGIGDNAFYNGTNIEGELVIPEGVTHIGDNAFYNCTNIEGKLVIPEGVTHIGDNTFYNCTNLSRVVIPEGLKHIGDGVFYNCIGLCSTTDSRQGLYIPNGVISIGDNAFYNCFKLGCIAYIPESVTSIGKDALYTMCAIKGTKGSFAETYARENDMSFYSYDFTTRASGTYGNNCSWIVIDQSTLLISGAGKMQDVDRPEYVPWRRLWGGGSMSSMEISSAITHIGDYAFSDCFYMWASFVIPESITSIGKSAFEGCNGSREDLVIPDSVTSIGERAFSGCKNFKGELVISSNLKSIEESVFSGCSGFTGSLVIPESVTSIGSSAFSGCSGFTGSLVIPESVTSIGWNAFSGCSGFTGDLVIPDSVTSIGEKAFFDCRKLSGIAYIPASVKEIGEDALSTINTIYGVAGSAAETYAEENDIEFMASYMITFDSAGGTEVETQMLEKEQTVKEPEKPVREGYVFLGWYLDDEAYDFKTPVTDSICLVAKWREKVAVDILVANMASGSEVAKGTEIILKTATPGARIYYTLDGSVPTTASTLYRAPIIIKDDVVIKAYAVKEDWYDSGIAVFTYTVPKTGDVLPEDIPEGGIEAIPAGLWIAGVEETGYEYTGTAIKPAVRVYDGMTLLKEKQDYTIAYKSNTKVNDASDEKKAPTITVTGKGNYTGKETATFKILQKNIADIDITATDMLLGANEKVQKPVPTVLRNGKKLKNKTDFTVEYPDLAEENVGAYKEVGTYTILIKGKGGYSGERAVALTITESKLMSKASVSKIKNQTYTGAAIEPAVTVKFGKTVLIEGTDYSVAYANNKEIGTASIIITGKGDYVGEKTVTFKIAGTAINKAKVTGIPKSVIYTGSDITTESTVWGNEPVLTVVVNKETKTLIEGTDYTVSYQKNNAKGTASIIFTGINGYSGTLKKTFKINAYDIAKDVEEQMTAFIVGQPVYAKGGSKPEPVVMFGNTVLKVGVDYTLSYKNDTKINDGTNAKKLPTVTIKGKGNFSGSIALNYIIESQDISLLSMTVEDKVYSTKANAYKSVPKIIDLDGKTLKAGTDYEKNIVYTYKYDTVLEDGTERKTGEAVGAKDILPAGTVVVVTVTGKGNYNSDTTLQGEYRIVAGSIAKASVKVENQIYTGQAVEPEKDAVTVKVGKITLTADDYDIISYSNNVKKGTATMTIRGKGNYGGTKTVKFTIKSKGLFWN